MIHPVIWSCACCGRKLTRKGTISKNNMTDYIYLIHPFRHEFFDAPTPEEELAMEEHFEYLKHGDCTGSGITGGTLPG